MITRLVTSVVANGLALFAAQYVVPGFTVSGGWQEYLTAAVVLGLLNLVVKPILKTISLPLIVLTLGLFTLVINAALLWGLAWWFPFITVATWQALGEATLIMTVVNFLVSHASRRSSAF